MKKLIIMAVSLLGLTVLGLWFLSYPPSHLVITKATETSRATEIYDVLKVVDGDTIVVNIQGLREKVRLLGVNTPESVDPRKPVQCFGKEAKIKAAELMNGNPVSLESDPSQGDRDNYGRLLRYVYVYLPNKTIKFVNKELIQEGFAHEYTYKIPHQYQKEFKEAELKARSAKRGLWKNDACAAESKQKKKK